MRTKLSTLSTLARRYSTDQREIRASLDSLQALASEQATTHRDAAPPFTKARAGVLRPYADKPAPQDVILVSVDKHTGADVSDWGFVGETMRKYNRDRQGADTLRLATRIESLRLCPPLPVVEHILHALAQARSVRAAAPAVVRLLERVLQRRALLAPSTERSLFWCLRRCDADPLLRHALYSQLRRYLDEVPRPAADDAHFQLQAAYVQALASAGELEHAITLYKELLAEGAAPAQLLPTSMLVDKIMMKERHGSVRLYEDLLKDTAWDASNRGVWAKVLDYSVHGGNASDVEAVWAKAVIPGLVEPSDDNMQRMLEEYSVADIGPEAYSGAFRRLSLQEQAAAGESPALDAGQVAGLLNALASSDKIAGPREFLQVLELCHAFWPALSYKQLDPAMAALWCKPGLDRAAFYVAFVEHAPSALLEGVLDDTAFRTFVLNLVVRGHRELWAPSASLFVFRAFLRGPSGATPDAATFEELAAAAMYLKHGKLLSKRIYDDAQLFGIAPTPRLFELLIRGNARGRELSSVLYYVAELRRRAAAPVTLPPYLAAFLLHQFAKSRDPRLAALLKDGTAAAQYADFPSAAQLKASNSRGRKGMFVDYSYLQDAAYARNYVEGWPYHELPPPK